MVDWVLKLFEEAWNFSGDVAIEQFLMEGKVRQVVQFSQYIYITPLRDDAKWSLVYYVSHGINWGIDFRHSLSVNLAS